MEQIYRLPEAEVSAGFLCNEPRAVRSRPRERVIADRTDLSEDKGRFVLSNVYEGRNMAGVQPGEIRDLLVLETLAETRQLHRRHGTAELWRHLHAGTHRRNGAGGGRRLSPFRIAGIAQLLLSWRWTKTGWR